MSEISNDLKRDIELESQIRHIIKNDNNADTSLHFRFQEYPKPHEIDIITYNPRHKTFFLFDTYTTTTNEKTKILEEILDFLKHKINPSHYFTYKIKWFYDNNFYTSYFNGYSLEDVCKKFYFKNNPHDYIIHSAQLVPTE